MQMDQDTVSTAELRRDVSAQARSVIETQTKGTTPIAFYYPDNITILSVAKDDEGAYHVTAFVEIAGQWAHSFDAQGVTADEAFEVLSRRVMS